MLDEPSSVTVCAISSEQRKASFRVPLEPNAGNGLEHPSLVLIDKITTIRASSVDRELGEVDEATMLRVNEELRFWLDL